jgi:hypothetical protein
MKMCIYHTAARTPSRPFYLPVGIMNNGFKVHFLPLKERKIDVIFAVLILIFGDDYFMCIPRNE